MPSDVPSALSKRETIALRRLEAFRLMRENLQEARKMKAEEIKNKKQLPAIVNKLCQSPSDPREDCFAMTLDDAPPKPKPILQIAKDAPVSEIANDGLPRCVGNWPLIVINSDHVSEALIFYKNAFGAELMEFRKKRKRCQEKTAYLKIGAQTCVIISGDNNLSLDAAHFSLFSLLADDVDGVVNKALKAGATLSGKVVRVYSKCRTWCKLVKVYDPFGNVWIIYSKLCPSCLKSFMVLV